MLNGLIYSLRIFKKTAFFYLFVFEEFFEEFKIFKLKESIEGKKITIIMLFFEKVKIEFTIKKDLIFQMGW
jgi:hypothetical protein